MYGEKMEGISKKGDKYGFVNELEIRIATGIKLVLVLLSMFLILFKGEFEITFYIVFVIFLDFFIKVFISPKYSIFGIIVRPFIKNKEKIMVGAIQKRFAWSIGLFMASFVIFCLLVLGGKLFSSDPNILKIIKIINYNIMSYKLIVVPMNPAILACFLCIVFMWFESVAGYCIGCSIYAFLVKKGFMKKYEGQNCINGTCEIK